MTIEHRTVMETAIRLGKQSRSEDERAHPRVGAVVMKDGGILAEAFRGELAKGDHAEFTLFERHLRDQDVCGAVLFTTLEPCTTRKSHKPCAEWIVEKRIGCVFIGMLDPNPRIYGQGVRRLREGGVRVEFFPQELREIILADNASFIEQYHAHPALVGNVTFNSTHNNGFYTLGHGELTFQTRWSNASSNSIHSYTDGTDLQGLGLALGAASFHDIRDASVYDMTSRVRTAREGEFLVFRNAYGKYAAARMMDIRARSHGDEYDSLSLS